MPTVLITGANRGIGLEFARQYAADRWTVIGTARAPEHAAALQETGARILPLEIADPKSIEALGRAIGNEPVDLLIASAGIYGQNEFDADGWDRVLRVNAIGPTLLAQALRANVSASNLKRMVAVTSGMGSIGETAGGHIPYRTSKAALNMAWKNLAIDYARDGVAVAVINPGWVKTDMGGPGASITPERSIQGMRRIIDTLTLEQSGRFLSWDGREYPW